MASYKQEIDEKINKEAFELSSKVTIDEPGAPFNHRKTENIHSIRIREDRIVVVLKGEKDPANRYSYCTIWLHGKAIDKIHSMVTERISSDVPEGESEFLWDLALYMDLYLNRDLEGSDRQIRMTSRPIKDVDYEKDGTYLKESAVKKLCTKGTEVYEGFTVFNKSYVEDVPMGDISL